MQYKTEIRSSRGGIASVALTKSGRFYFSYFFSATNSICPANGFQGELIYARMSQGWTGIILGRERRENGRKRGFLSMIFMLFATRKLSSAASEKTFLCVGSS